jgi:hypothetical protein
MIGNRSQMRADGVWLVEHADTPASLSEAEKKINASIQKRGLP